MTEEDEIRVDARIDPDHWNTLTEYIDENKESGKESKQFYVERIVSMALSLKQMREQQEKETHESYKDLRREIKNDLDL